jgi:hypothetical protein
VRRVLLDVRSCRFVCSCVHSSSRARQRIQQKPTARVTDSGGQAHAMARNQTRQPQNTREQSPLAASARRVWAAWPNQISMACRDFRSPGSRFNG